MKIREVARQKLLAFELSHRKRRQPTGGRYSMPRNVHRAAGAWNSASNRRERLRPHFAQRHIECRGGRVPWQVNTCLTSLTARAVADGSTCKDSISDHDAVRATTDIRNYYTTFPLTC